MTDAHYLAKVTFVTGFADPTFLAACLLSTTSQLHPHLLLRVLIVFSLFTRQFKKTRSMRLYIKNYIIFSVSIKAKGNDFLGNP